ncbi:hypothetical protein [Streptomyces vietnamensis]|uniref:PPM-type phosphatase domain-containing protein n=1 Tax=Streptomyces vietnamensis TaxID=362257 RepID=A0A0B5HS01_9ACTN|nr:hypothetical protein [Streptomyces vietnamensis]AJF64845.1 hypothetical protein SVTN_10790 [Streptomyces vietnamensis]
MKILERSVTPKTGNLDACEDGIVVCDGYVAVIDGATDKTGARYRGLTGGRHVMLVLSDAIPRLPPSADAYAVAGALTDAVAEGLPGNLSPELRPSASVTLFSAARREVWQIGDVGFWYQGLAQRQERKQVDLINTAMRVALLKAEMLDGAAAEQLAAHDPGREVILPLLTRQALFANTLRAGTLAYAAIDGRPVPHELIRVVGVPSPITELVLASDGYPAILPSLAESESHLKTLLAADPLCVDELAGTKAVKPGHSSYDDRSYLRLEI